jgi:hypothetical protein
MLLFLTCYNFQYHALFHADSSSTLTYNIYVLQYLRYNSYYTGTNLSILNLLQAYKAIW